MKSARLLTTIPGIPGKFWGDNTELISEKCKEFFSGQQKGKINKHLTALRIAIEMLKKQEDFDVIVVDGGPIGEWFSLLQTLTFYKKRPTLMIDCLWYRSSNCVVRVIKKIIKKLSARSIDKFAVWARHEVEDYSNEFGLPKEKFIYIPFHNTLAGYSFEIADEGFLFSGGNGDRDYRTLIEAIRGLDILVFIAARDKRLFQGIEIPANVTIQGLTHNEFRKKMAACRIAVVPMEEGLLHSGGQQTFLNSMAMGKPTIVVGSKVADGYVENGINGLVVNYKDINGLRKAVTSLWNDNDFRLRIGRAAEKFAAPMTTDGFVRNIFSLAEGLLS